MSAWESRLHLQRALPGDLRFQPDRPRPELPADLVRLLRRSVTRRAHGRPQGISDWDYAVAICLCRSYYYRMEVRWSQSSRRHGIGRAPARHVMTTVDPTESTTTSGEAALLWVGTDDRGVELEIVAAVLPELYLVIHVMPTALRRR